MVASAALLVGVYVVFVTTSLGQRAEYVALQAAELRFAGLQGLGLLVLSRLPEIVAVVAVGVFASVTVWRRRWRASMIAVLAFAAANLTTQLLKNVVLVRPVLDNGVPHYTGNSLPSGHTTFAAAAAVALVLVVAPRWRAATAAVGALFSVAVGTATFIEGWHRPADIATAYLVALFWGLAGGAVLAGEEPSRRSRPSGAVRWDGVLRLVGLVALVGACLSYAAAGAPAALVADPPLVSGWYFIGGMLFAAGAGLLSFAVLAGLFRYAGGRSRAAR